jgi:hypothetical protein
MSWADDDGEGNDGYFDQRPELKLAPIAPVKPKALEVQKETNFIDVPNDILKMICLNCDIIDVLDLMITCGTIYKNLNNANELLAVLYERKFHVAIPKNSLSAKQNVVISARKKFKDAIEIIYRYLPSLRQGGYHCTGEFWRFYLSKKLFDNLYFKTKSIYSIYNRDCNYRIVENNKSLKYISDRLTFNICAKPDNIADCDVDSLILPSQPKRINTIKDILISYPYNRDLAIENIHFRKYITFNDTPELQARMKSIGYSKRI